MKFYAPVVKGRVDLPLVHIRTTYRLGFKIDFGYLAAADSRKESLYEDSRCPLRLPT